MKIPPLVLALAIAGCGGSPLLVAQTEDSPPTTATGEQAPPAEKTPIMAALEELMGAIGAKMQATEGGLTPATVATELARFDEIVTQFSDAPEIERASVLWAKALVFIQVFEDYDQAITIVKRFKTEYPTTEFAEKADEIVGSIELDRDMSEVRSAMGAGEFDRAIELVRQAQAKRPGSDFEKNADEIVTAIEKQRATAALSSSLVVGAEFPAIEGKATDGTSVSTAKLAGKVVLIDFWATWCPPCRAELPYVAAAYTKYHDKGFEVIGISLDRDEDELAKFVAEQKMAWPQLFENASEIADKFGVESIPTTYLVGPDGKIVATNLRGGDPDGNDLETQLGKLLGKE